MKWEYKTITMNTKGFTGGIIEPDELDKGLNRLGSDGWELVSALDTNYEGGRSRLVVAIFKRPQNA